MKFCTDAQMQRHVLIQKTTCEIGGMRLRMERKEGLPDVRCHRPNRRLAVHFVELDGALRRLSYIKHDLDRSCTSFISSYLGKYNRFERRYVHGVES